MTMMSFKKSLIASCVLAYCFPVYGQAKTVENLDKIVVSTDGEQRQSKDNKVGQTVKTSNQLSKQQVQDSRDLVRYETGVSVVENGRFGSSGYAIRGVDENRVAIVVDGLHQAETLSSQGFKEIFEGYGNFNNTRNSVEIETLKKATIQKGADSIRVGSGALGGSVVFETKDARDYLTEKDWHLGYKTSYSTADNQGLNSVTAAGRYKWFDLLVVHTKRHGHELENYDYKYAQEIQTKIREKADPYTITKESTLVKFSFSPSENNRFTIVYDNYENRSRGHDFSYNLKGSTLNAIEDALRHTNDSSKRKNYGFSYENYSSTPFWDTLKISYSEQKIKNSARTDDYCDGSHCKDLQNPAGLQVKNGSIVDYTGKPIDLKYDDVNDRNYIVGPNNQQYDNQYFNLKRTDQTWFDCSIFDCRQPMTVYKWNGWYQPYTQETITLNSYSDDGKFAKYDQYGYYAVMPSAPGYLEDTYTQRDLDTNTKQLNLDLTKQVNLWGVENNFEYGGAYSRVRKSMTNRTGYRGDHAQWWASRIPTSECGLSSTTYADAILNCPKEELYSFLIPVKMNNKSFYFVDNLVVNQYLDFNLGYRFDTIRYKPDYNPKRDPKLPDDMVKGFVPVNYPHPNLGNMPSYSDYDYDWQQYSAAVDEYNKKKAANEAAEKDNIQANIDYFSKPKKYTKHSYALETGINPTDYIRLQLKYAKGFRAPTNDELYFTFKHPDFSILPNVNLKPEESKNKEIALTFFGDVGFITTSLFRTDYKNFIDLKYLGAKHETNSVGGQARAVAYQYYQNINRDNAKITGIEMHSKLNVGYFLPRLQGLSLSYKYTYQKGRVDGDMPMNAIQPRTSVIGVGYQHPEELCGVDLYVTHASAKKSKDTYNMYWKEEGKSDSSVKWRSDDYTLVDLIGYVKPIKNLTLQAGVYNLTDRKYLTWESARSIKPFGTSNLIDQETGKGINRFYSPGRNFKLTAELTF
ncbi:TonB-dependent hemoglobin/transferrin/lactoferrin family receptor [Lonepinella koalarum]|uniref:TonB-dependent hemoglobin/transferrin/lactoferrin family receptor n=1 Tax=Lonepinella koalarum TaxID=53417 RepID=UPI003F6E2249